MQTFNNNKFNKLCYTECSEPEPLKKNSAPAPTLKRNTAPAPAPAPTKTLRLRRLRLRLRLRNPALILSSHIIHRGKFIFDNSTQREQIRRFF